MTENTVPRVAKFADIKVGQTIERVYTHPSGSTVTHMGVASKVAAHIASDDAGLGLATPSDDGNSCITLRILADPTPKLPTTPGTVIDCTLDGEPGAVLVRGGNFWHGIDPEGFTVQNVTSPTGPHKITDWTVVYDPSAPEADPLDENDHRDRIDGDGFRITRHGNKHWHTKTTTCYGHCRDNSLANWDAACGPLRFADEVTA